METGERHTCVGDVSLCFSDVGALVSPVLSSSGVQPPSVDGDAGETFEFHTPLTGNTPVPSPTHQHSNHTNPLAQLHAVNTTGVPAVLSPIQASMGLSMSAATSASVDASATEASLMSPEAFCAPAPRRVTFGAEDDVRLMSICTERSDSFVQGQGVAAAAAPGPPGNDETRLVRASQLNMEFLRQRCGQHGLAYGRDAMRRMLLGTNPASFVRARTAVLFDAHNSAAHTTATDPTADVLSQVYDECYLSCSSASSEDADDAASDDIFTDDKRRKQTDVTPRSELCGVRLGLLQGVWETARGQPLTVVGDVVHFWSTDAAVFLDTTACTVRDRTAARIASRSLGRPQPTNTTTNTTLNARHLASLGMDTPHADVLSHLRGAPSSPQSPQERTKKVEPRVRATGLLEEGIVPTHNTVPTHMLPELGVEALSLQKAQPRFFATLFSIRFTDGDVWTRPWDPFEVPILVTTYADLAYLAGQFKAEGVALPDERLFGQRAVLDNIHPTNPALVGLRFVEPEARRVAEAQGESTEGTTWWPTATFEPLTPPMHRRARGGGTNLPASPVAEVDTAQQDEALLRAIARPAATEEEEGGEEVGRQGRRHAAKKKKKARRNTSGRQRVVFAVVCTGVMVLVVALIVALLL